MIKEFNILINDPLLVDKRLDLVLTNETNLTRSHIKKYLDKLIVNGKKEKLSYKCRYGDNILFSYSYEDSIKILPENIPIDIVYEDENYIIVNKDSGIVTHPAKGNWSGTLLNGILGLKKELSDINEEYRMGIVHRLDKDTSGLIILAKNNSAHSYLQELFVKRKIKKYYKAISKGFVTPSIFTIENMIGRDPKNRKKMAVVHSRGKEAITKVKVLKRLKDYSYLLISLKTGRTHQIRVHLSNLGYPILGDSIYGRKDKKYGDIKLCLVSYRVSFFDKFSNINIDVKIGLPKHFKKVIINSG
jgi:23S rRNA pseudouridine1911/1915/1917 synthase